MTLTPAQSWPRSNGYEVLLFAQILLFNITHLVTQR